MFHDFLCFDQSCNPEFGECGSSKMITYFADILSALGGKSIEYFEHVEVTYVKSDLTKVCLFNHVVQG